MQRTPPDSPDLPSLLNNLGNGLRDRYARTGQLADLEEAIRVFQQAVQRTPPDSPDLPSLLNGLGNGLSDRYARTAQLADLEEAIRVFRQAVQRTPPDSPSLPMYLSNLGNGLRAHYARTGQLADLEEAIRVFQQAVQRTPPDSPNLPSLLNSLGNGLRDRHARTGELADLEEAIRVYRSACQMGTETAMGEALRSSRNWGGWASERVAWEEAVQAYEYGLDAVERLFTTQVQRQYKESWLREARGLSVRAAYAYARTGWPEKAVEALEAGRARLLGEALERSRRDLDDLPRMGFGALHDRYRRADDHYQALVAQTESRAPDWLAQAQVAWHAVQEAVQSIREEVGTQHPEFRHFLRSLPWEEVRQQARNTPLAYLLVTPAGGLALLVAGAEVESVWADLSEQELNSLLVRTDPAGENVTGGYLPAQLAVTDWMPAALETLLPTLGRLMGPLAEALRRLDPPPATVVLIPTGRLALLPLHAATYTAPPMLVGDGAGPALSEVEAVRAFLDEFAVAYAPSTLALAAARAEAAARRGCPLRLAGVGDPLPPPETLAPLQERLRAAAAALPPPGQADNAQTAGLRQQLGGLLALPLEELLHEGLRLRDLVRRLPQAWGQPVQELVALAGEWPQSLRHAKAELQSVADLLPPGSAIPLYEQQATRAALLERLPEASLVHLACHGLFQADEPLRSGLLLAGGEEERLTLRHLLAPEFTGLEEARLVVLSACQTAVSDFRDLPDEAVGLPAGLLQAGAPAVVGALWNVDDASTALLMTRFYELLLQGEGEERGLPPPEALRRAQRWLRDLTNAGLEAYLARHEAIARARRESVRRMPSALIGELLIRAYAAVDPQAQPYVEPYYWAPFTFHGAEEKVR